MAADPALRARRESGPASTERRARQKPARPSLVARILLAPVHLWRATAPMRVPRCRFHPSCSTYALQALRRHGALRGGWMALRRLGRCHPWNPGGLDPVD